MNEAKDEQKKLRSDMGKKHLLKESREARANIENLCNARKPAIDLRKPAIYFFEEFTSTASEARRQAKKEQHLKY